MEITRNGSRPVNKGPAEFFTGSVQVEPLVKPPEPSRLQAAKVTFEPGARTAWHTHPLGQTLIVTDGCGAVQCWGEPLQIIRPGDVIWTPPGVRHWHGALPSSRMTHIAVLESLDGKNVDWLNHLNDDEYNSACLICESQANVSEPKNISTSTGGSSSAGAQAPASSLASTKLGSVSPALEKYDRETIGPLWARPELAARDRCIITVSALIARNQTLEMEHYFKFALDNGVKPRELSEIISHLAFYSGWPNAMSAVDVASSVFAQRKINLENLPLASPELLPINKEAEESRAANVEQQFGKVARGVVQYTSDVLFNDLWLRPDLKPRDRSLVTISALIASGQVAQIPYHLNRAMDNGLTQEEASEVLTHLAFYVGWPRVFSALPIAKEVFEKRVK